MLEKINVLDVLCSTGVGPERRDLAMVFQSHAPYPYVPISETIGFGLRVSGINKSTIDRSINNVVQMPELRDHLDREPTALYGGQRQRVAIGRAIVQSSSAFLFDEPLSKLDAPPTIEQAAT